MEIKFIRTEECPACGHKEGRKRLYPLKDFSVYECSCGHLFIDPQLDPTSMMWIYQSSEALTRINPACKFYYEYETLDPKSKTYQEYLGALKGMEQFTSGRTLLDVGCGNANFLKLARLQGWETVGVDPSPENIRNIQQQGIEAHCSGFLEFKPSRKFDCIALWDLIEHPGIPALFIDKVKNLLSEDGVLFIGCPLYPNLLSVLADCFYKMSAGVIQGPLHKMYMLEHTSYFSIGSLEGLLQRGKFRTLKYWKTETDLNRYHFPWPVRLALQGSFALARILSLQNRMNLFARPAE
ncbi:MAG: class I SAM-dependent methyltransferase [Candidatus Omnitrophica bacterium]|nr:class I SAM-dependent methyltransferase [Candidatus Omnitrophota bacterium]